MTEQRTIILPRNMPINKRISAAKKEVTKWLNSLDEPLKVGKDVVYLLEHHVNGYHTYRYAIHRDVEF